MPLHSMKNFIKLKEESLAEIPSSDETLYGIKPIYCSLNNMDLFNGAKFQILLLIDKIIYENPSALSKLKELKENLTKLETTGINHNQADIASLLQDLKKRLESLYYYNRSLLRKLQNGQLTDLTFEHCYQGAYANTIMFIDRVISGGGINSYLLAAKREFIQQQALNYIEETDIGHGDVHFVNSLYNHVAPSYNMCLIQDRLAHIVSDQNLESFDDYLREHLTASALINILEKNFVISNEYNHLQMESILPKSLYGHWVYALYNNEGISHDISRTGRLLLLVILQDQGFIEGFVKETIIHSGISKQYKKVYQTDNDIFIEEWVENEITYELRPMVRVFNSTKGDSNLLIDHYNQLQDGFTPLIWPRLSLNIINWSRSSNITEETKIQLVTALCHVGSNGWTGIRALGHYAPKSFSSALTLAITKSAKAELISALCQVDQDGHTGISALGHYAPKPFSDALALATTKENKSKLVTALCHVGNNGWTGIRTLVRYTPESFSAAFVLATTEAAKEQLLTALCYIGNDGGTGLKTIAIYAPKLVNTVLALATTKENKSKLVTALCHVGNNGWTGLKAIARYAPKSINVALALATTEAAKEQLLTALCHVDQDGWTGLEFIARYGSKSINATLALATTESAKEQLLTALCHVDQYGWTGLKTIARYGPKSINAALTLATTEAAKEQLLTALCHVDQDGGTGLKTIARNAPKSINATLALATTEAAKKQLLTALCYIGNDGGTGLKTIAIYAPKLVNTVLALATTKENKSKLVTALCHVGNNGSTGLKTIARYAPKSINVALALATTEAAKEQLLTALCHVDQDGWTGLKTIARNAPKLMNSAFDLATTEAAKEQLLTALCHVDQDGNTGLETIATYTSKSINTVLSLATTDFCKSIVILSHAGVFVSNNEEIKANVNLQKALVSAFNYLHSHHFGWNRSHGDHGKEQTYEFIKNLMARENKDLKNIQTEMKQWIRGYGSFSRSSNCHGFSRVSFASQSGLFSQPPIPFFEMRKKDRKLEKQAILNFGSVAI
ncbi:hypothetical protein PsalN5692_03945 (plasmid) [Piscirickettsia salmonis]|uniref:hypothetical protein n=2 Tax=Piscirickettsia salmonis TaxID=1238 RepID=UPI0018ACFC63|nr:hypothetical protein PsalN5692_03945 [Piscirickettsia salmonis]